MGGFLTGRHAGLATVYPWLRRDGGGDTDGLVGDVGLRIERRPRLRSTADASSRPSEPMYWMLKTVACPRFCSSARSSSCTCGVLQVGVKVGRRWSGRRRRRGRVSAAGGAGTGAGERGAALVGKLRSHPAMVLRKDVRKDQRGGARGGCWGWTVAAARVGEPELR